MNREGELMATVLFPSLSLNYTRHAERVMGTEQADLHLSRCAVKPSVQCLLRLNPTAAKPREAKRAKRMSNWPNDSSLWCLFCLPLHGKKTEIVRDWITRAKDRSESKRERGKGGG